MIGGLGLQEPGTIHHLLFITIQDSVLLPLMRLAHGLWGPVWNPLVLNLVGKQYMSPPYCSQRVNPYLYSRSGLGSPLDGCKSYLPL